MMCSFWQAGSGSIGDTHSLTVAEICDVENEPDPLPSDVRPHVKDGNSGKWCLVDTGAVLSIWPWTDFPEAKLDDKPLLRAVNGTPIATYGTVEKKLKLGPIERIFVVGSHWT